MKRIKRALAALVWLVVAVLVALGGAGVVAGMNHVPGTDARAELTYGADRAAKAQLDAATDDLQALGASVDTLGEIARSALAAVVSGDVDQATRDISDGTQQIAVITAAAATLQASIDAVPGVGNGSLLRVSPEVQDRYDGLASTPALVTGLADDWIAFTGRALDAANLNKLLGEHDRQTALAAQHGAKAQYKQALDDLAASDQAIAEIKVVRDRVARLTDVSTLDEWVKRVAGYDAALRNLYEVLIKADGKVTNKVRRAFDAEQVARRQLPGDTRALVVIMAEIAQAGLNQAVISIEETRGSLSDALDIQRQLEQDVTIALPE